VRYELQPGLGLSVRKYILHKRGVLASDKARKPAARLSRETSGEIDFLLDRLHATAPQAARRAAS
jgi:4-hydroxy-tetrahydrodipicolinate synthase